MSKQINYKKFGQIISGIRREKGLSQQKVCDELNISTSYYSDIENGNVNPSIDILVGIANFYNIPLSDTLLSKPPAYNIPAELKKELSKLSDSTIVNALDVINYALQINNED